MRLPCHALPDYGVVLQWAASGVQLQRDAETRLRRARSVWADLLASRTRLFASALILMLLVGTQARTFALFRCEYTGATLSSCCCPTAESEHAFTPVLSRGCCCHVETVDGALPAGATNAQALSLPALALSFAVLEIDARPALKLTALEPNASMTRYAQRTRAGPKTRLTIVHRRLLI